MFKKTLDYGGAGDNVGCLLRTVKREDVQRGQVLAQPGTVKVKPTHPPTHPPIHFIHLLFHSSIIHPPTHPPQQTYKEFEAELYVLTQEEGKPIYPPTHLVVCPPTNQSTHPPTHPLSYRWTTHPFPQQLPPTILHPHGRRHWFDHAGGREGDGHAWR